DPLSALSSRSFCPCDSRSAGLLYLPAGWWYTTARSCPQLYCSNVQYTSEMLFRRCGGNTGTHHHVAAATLRCPRGGLAKSAFEILIHTRSREGTCPRYHAS